MNRRPVPFAHPTFPRRTALQAGSIGLLGLGLGELDLLRAAGPAPPRCPARAVVYVFLSGGLSQLDSFDPKPDAPAGIRGEFASAPTAVPGIRICEHLPGLAERARRWALVRSLTHPTNNHPDGHLLMLTGRSVLPPGYNPAGPQPTDWPSLAAVAGAVTRPRNNLPPAVVLPDRIVHNTGHVIPGQFAGLLGRARDPWFLEMSPFEPRAYGAFPGYEFDHSHRPYTPRRVRFSTPSLTLPEGVDGTRFDDRLDILRHIDGQRRGLDLAAAAGRLDRSRADAVGLLVDPRVRKAFDLDRAPARDLDRYGRNAFGWSLLMAARLVEAGVNLVQVNLGNNETWDTHGNAFPHLRDKLFPPTDKALSALLDDLTERGLLDDTLVVMAGEFGRTPHLGGVGPAYRTPGRDHWGAVQTVWLAGGGVRGGRVVGASDKNGGHPADAPQTPENLGATIYRALGLPRETAWADAEGRPHHIYEGEPMPV